MLVYKKGIIRNSETTEIITEDCSPKFENWTYEMYQADTYIKFLDPMLASPADKDNIPEEDVVAEEKLDGNRSLCYLTPQGNRFFSRRISKKTNWYAENTDQLPHLRDYKGLSSYNGTVLDGEITMPTVIFADVQGVTGALPETALQNQIEKGFAIYNVFDILYYKGVNIQHIPLWKRKLYLAEVLRNDTNPCIIEVPYYSLPTTSIKFTELKNTQKNPKWYLEPVPKKVESFSNLLKEMWEEGKEGLIIKDIYGKYEQKRTKQYLKLKNIKTYDVVIMDYEEPTKYYDGKTLDEKGYWDYWCSTIDEHYIVKKRVTLEEADKRGLIPVTKPYAMNWIGSIDVGVYKEGKLVKVAEVKGLDDAMQEYIRTNRDKLIGTCIEIKGQEIISKETGSIRHPRFSRFRNDKNGEDCLWENHLLVG